MKQRHGLLFGVLTISFLALGQFSGCASYQLTRLDDPVELPDDVSKEVAEKFRVEETEASETAQDAQASLKSGAKPNLQKSAKPSKKKPAAATRAFSYPDRRPEQEAIYLGEKHVFEVRYIGVTAGIFTTEVLPFKQINNRKVYHIRGSAVSSKLFNVFYRINDRVETYIDYDGLFSHRFHLVLDESKQTRNSLELYDSEKKETFYWNRWNHETKGYNETKEFKPIVPFPQDSLSALFYLRMIPLPMNKLVTFPIVSEGKYWTGAAKVVRKEWMQTPLGRKEALVLELHTKYEDTLKQEGNSYLWLTNDDRRFVLRLEAKVRVGSIVAALVELQTGVAP